MRVVDRSLSRFPRPLRTLIDWTVTITLAVVGVLVFQAEIAKPYRIPSASMEPTLHCGKPADGCRSRVSDRVIANRIVYRFHAPERGDIIVFNAPARVESGLQRRWRVRQADRRASWREGLDAETVTSLINGVRLREPISPPPIAGGRAANGPGPPEAATSCSATTAPCRATHAAGASFRARASSVEPTSATLATRSGAPGPRDEGTEAARRTRRAPPRARRGRAAAEAVRAPVPGRPQRSRSTRSSAPTAAPARSRATSVRCTPSAAIGCARSRPRSPTAASRRS